MADSDPSRVVFIEHYSDVFCVWAYCAQIRVEELQHAYGARVALRYRFIPVFGSTQKKIGHGWPGGFSAYAKHTRSVVARFPHVTMHEDTWERVQPASSAAAHLFLKAVQLVEGPGASPSAGSLERAAWGLRLAFFRDGRDVAHRSVQLELCEQLGIARAPIEAALVDSTAMAALCEDIEAQATQKIVGSPTLVLNEGRQRLYGNVGYRVIEANVEELLRDTDPHAASWC